MARRLLTILWLILTPLPLVAAEAVLLADTVTVGPGNLLIADGNVEVIYEGTRLTASRIVYDPAADRLSVSGPILITGPDGVTLLAQEATLDPRLRNGLLRGARLILAERLQLQAVEIARIEGRYNRLTQVAATSCAVCGDRDPLWVITASEVVHDEELRRLYFTNAQLRFLGLPIMWVPRLRMPDPTVDRATGFLFLSGRTTNQLGLGWKLPYFIVLGDDRDLTLTPYLSPVTTTLEARYRQAFVNGDLAITGAVSSDKLVPGQMRGYVFADAGFDLADNYRLGLALRLTSDKAYLLDYGYSNADRLQSGAHLSRTRERNLIALDLELYQSLREGDDPLSLPPVILDGRVERRFKPSIGGTLALSTALDAAWRPSETPGPAGRDLIRLGAAADWHRRFVTGPGLVIDGGAGLGLDGFAVMQDPGFDPLGFKIEPQASLTLRWPFLRKGVAGSEMIEPVVAFAWSDRFGAPMPDEDSPSAEFDTGNLFALSRFPGEDLGEAGPRLALGGSYSFDTGLGTKGAAALGRVFRATPAPFNVSSGLDGLESDWLLSGRLDLGDGLRLDGRTLLDPGLGLGKTEARIMWRNDRVDLAASYVFLPIDPAENRTAPMSEWAFASDWTINDRWRIGFDGRYDVAAATPAFAEVRLGWQNECLAVDLSVSRRYTSSITVDPSTNIGLSVELLGFTAGTPGRSITRHCAN